MNKLLRFQIHRAYLLRSPMFFILGILLWAGTAFGQTVTENFNFTGAPQTFTVPAGVFSVDILVQGAQGGSGMFNSASTDGALGGEATGTLAVTPGDILNIYVGGMGQNDVSSNTPAGGGYNGGGNASFFNSGTRGGGGGATDVRINGNTLNNRIIVGGGGGGTSGLQREGGAGGGLIGQSSVSIGALGGGGTQTMGGITGNSFACENGSFGIGGSTIFNGGCSGGGGGWYGGASGDGGGGGSGYIGGVTDGTFQTGVRSGNGFASITYCTPICMAVATDILVVLSADVSNGTGSITAADVDDGSTGCTAAGITLSIDQTDFTCDDTGSMNTVTLTVTDNGDNSFSTCTANVVVQDITPPVPVCTTIADGNVPDIVLDANGLASLMLGDVLVSATENCAVAPGGQVTGSAFVCADIGAQTVTVTVFDVNGLGGNCTADINVVDNIDPVAVCQDITVELDATGNVSIIPADIDNGSSDVCGFTLSLDITDFDCDDVNNPVTVILTATDPSNNTDDCTATVTIEDNEAPTITCANVVADADANCLYTGGSGLVTVGDNCAPVAVSGVRTAPDGTTFAFSVIALQDGSFTYTAGGGLGVTTFDLTVTDAAGNTANCTQTITVSDVTAPTPLCQDITVQLGADDNMNGDDDDDDDATVSIDPAAIDNGSTDNCTANADLTFTADITDFDCSNLGANAVQVTVTDEAGNSETCDVTVTVEDDVAPILSNCVGLTVDADENCQFTPVLFVPTAFTFDVEDNCNNNTLSIVLTDMDGTLIFSGTAFPIPNGSYEFSFNGVSIPLGVNDFILTATDDSGNSDDCMSSITVQDVTPPTPVCMDATVVLDDTGAGSIDTDDIDDGSNDNCTADADLTFALDVTDFDCSNVNVTNTVTLTVTDEAGNSDDCTATVTVLDNSPPEALCQNTIVDLDVDGLGSITAADIDNGSNDPCGIASLDLDITDFDCDDVLFSPITVTLTVTDNSGNEATCTAEAAVRDLVAPEALCQDVTVQLDADGNGETTAAAVDNGSNDACGIAPNFPTLSQLTFNCMNLGDVEVTLTVQDVNGNADQCTATVTVEDNIAPELVCAPVTVELDSAGNGTFTGTDAFVPFGYGFTLSENGNGSEGYVGATVTAVSDITYSFDYAYTTDDPGFDAFFYSVNDSDAGGNGTLITAASGTGSVSVPLAAGDQLTIYVITSDNLFSTVNQADITGISVGLEGDYSLDNYDFVINNVADGTFEPLVAGPTDNCTSEADLIASLTPSATDFGCADVGDNTVTLTVTDGSGNTADCDVTVTVEDNIAPIAICQNITVELDSMGNGTALAADVDNGSSDACGIASLTLDNDAFTCANIGATNSVTLTVTDNNGNTATCDADVTVEDNIAPEALCMDAVVNLDNDGNGSIDTDDIDNGSNDACGIASVSLNITDFTCDNVGDNTVTLTVTDVNDNSATCNATVLVQDLIPAEIQCRQPVSTTTDAGVCGVEDLTVLEPFSIFDNCGAENVTFTRLPAGNDFPVGTTTLNWTATDANGNTSTCESLVIITDSEAPTIASCNAEVTFLEPGSCLANVIVTAQDVADNCGVASITGTGIFSLPIGIHPNPITVTDVNGNVFVHDFTIYVHDDQDPEFQNCPEETVVLQAGVNGTATYPQPMPTATDNCGVPTMTNDLPADGLPLGNTTVTFTAEDQYGNTTDCVVDVEVTGGIALHPVNDIESSLEENETTQNVSWNNLNAGTICELCEETELEGFRYVGTWWGHQYFLADDMSLTRDEASLIAEGYDAHLAVINDAQENAYLTEALDDEIRSAWIGLLPQMIDGEWAFAWDNGDAFDFDVLDFDAITADTRIILSNDGTWEDATSAEDKYFLIERPCVDFTQTAPMYTATEDEEPVMLRSGDAWPEGEYEVTYALTDMCGNEAVMTFDVSVLPEIAEYCTTEGTDNAVWIEQVVFHDLTNDSENNEGYADFTEEGMTMNIGDGVILVNLTAGGNEAENTLYWNIFMDRNADGDFFDAGEMIYQVASDEDVQANVTLPVETVENARLRVMVSRYNFAEPCGDTYVGEIEDYNVSLLIPEDYARAACDVQVAGLNGEKTGINIDLDWTVNSACPIENYRVESSVNGGAFSTVTQIDETDVSDIFYAKDFATQLPEVNGEVTYRIRVQPEGFPAFYTNTVTFDAYDAPNTPTLYPNPADTRVAIRMKHFVGQDVTVTVHNSLGRIMLQREYDNVDSEVSLDLRKFIDGFYHVTIQAEGKRLHTEKLVVDKLYGWSPKK